MTTAQFKSKFTGIWRRYWLVDNVILTPELATEATYIPWIQLGIAFAVLSKRSLWIAGLGILVLYSIAIYEYGLFHF